MVARNLCFGTARLRMRDGPVETQHNVAQESTHHPNVCSQLRFAYIPSTNIPVLLLGSCVTIQPPKKVSSIFQPPKSYPQTTKTQKIPAKISEIHLSQTRPATGASQSWGPRAKGKAQGDALDAYGGDHRGDVDVHIGLVVHVQDQLQAVLRRRRESERWDRSRCLKSYDSYGGSINGSP